MSDGEFVLPADTVRKVGVRSLRDLVATTHKPSGKFPRRGHFADGGMPDDEEQKRQNSFGDAAAAARDPNVTVVGSPASNAAQVPQGSNDTTPPADAAQIASDRAAAGRFGAGFVSGLDNMARAAGDIAGLPVRGVAGALDTAVVRPLRAAGVDVGYLSPHLVPPGADPASMTPFTDQKRQAAGENALIAKVDGVEHAVLFNEDNARAMRMAAALKNLDAARLEGALGAVGEVTRYLAAVNTQYNPIFGVTNLVRDFQEAAINLQATPLKGKQKQVLGNALKAAWQIGQALRAQREGKTTNSEYGKLWEEFQNEGGQTGYRDQFANSADRARALQKMLQPDAWAESKLGRFFTANGRLRVPMEMVRKSALRPLLDWLSDYNEAIENGMRLSAYKAGLDAGMSKQQAANLAKNLTVNFNRKGQMTQQVGALYAFFNASVQGTARMGQTLFTMEPGKPKTIKLSGLGEKVVYGGVLLGSMQAMLLAMAGFGDDEPPEFIRERNLVIPNPLSEKGYISIPMPLGYHVITNLGRIPTEYALGGFKGGQRRR